MSGPEDAFPYNSIVGGSDFQNLKETDLLDYNDDDPGNLTNHHNELDEDLGNHSCTDTEFDLSHLTLYDFIDEESMNKLNRNNDYPYFQDQDRIRETDLSGPQNIDDIKETDLCTFDVTSSESSTSTTTTIHSGGDVVGERLPTSYHHLRHNSLLSHASTADDDADSEQWNLDNAESVSLSTDSGITNEDCTSSGGKLTLDLDDLNHHLGVTAGGGIKFHELVESDFFTDTDCEAAFDRSPTDDCFETNRGQTKDLVRFQDIESDFFETDCEGAGGFDFDDDDYHSAHASRLKNQSIPTSTGSDTNSTIDFQDIESDFFDEEDEISPASLALRMTKRQQQQITKTTSTTLKSALSSTENTPVAFSEEKCKIKEQKQILSRLTSGKDKRATMTNNLLRTTIEELERALSNSNTLLVKRDQKIQELRKRNGELKKSLSEEVESSAQMKLLLLEKEAVVSEKEATIMSYQTEIDRLNQEISDLRIYKLNNFQDLSMISCDPANLDNSVETDLLGDQDEKTTPINTTNTENLKSPVVDKSKDDVTAQMTSPRRSFSPLNQQQQNMSTPKQQQTPFNGLKLSGNRSSFSNSSGSGSNSRGSLLMSPPSQGAKVSNNPDAVSSTELHARLQMKFMRDAFFYYMIGFHSDEQINAILAILDYGDKRQDFVLEAHKLKKSGKKFNVSKVSTRGLTFVQNIEPK